MSLISYAWNDNKLYFTSMENAWMLDECKCTCEKRKGDKVLYMAKLNAFRMLIFYMLMLYPFAFKIQCHFPSQGKWSIHCMSNSPMTIWCLLRVKYDSTVTVELVSSLRSAMFLIGFDPGTSQSHCKPSLYQLSLRWSALMQFTAVVMNLIQFL